MKDIDKLKELLDGWGVPYREMVAEYVVSSSVPEGSLLVYVEDGERFTEGAKVTGYCGFYTEYVFDTDGTFVSMGAWE